MLVVRLLLVPFVSNRGERAPSRRPVAVLSVMVIFAVLGVLTYYGATEPWSPVMGAWSGDARAGTAGQGEHARCSCRERSCFRTSSAATATPWTAWAAVADPT